MSLERLEKSLNGNNGVLRAIDNKVNICLVLLTGSIAMSWYVQSIINEYCFTVITIIYISLLVIIYMLDIIFFILPSLNKKNKDSITYHYNVHKRYGKNKDCYNTEKMIEDYSNDDLYKKSIALSTIDTANLVVKRTRYLKGSVIIFSALTVLFLIITLIFTIKQ